MTIQEIKELKDKVYELEGLLELAQLRDDKIDELTPLIMMRIDDLAEYGKVDAVKEIQRPKLNNPQKYQELLNPGSTLFDEELDENVKTDCNEVEVETEIPQLDIHDSIQEEMVDELESDIFKPAKPIFCLNDRFRFRRTLFNGSEDEFTEAMKQITLMDSYEEAEEYFLDKYGWNHEEEEVAAFFEILKEYFKIL